MTDLPTSTPTILFAGGGSGGHLAPGLAIIERLREAGAPVDCRFICSNRPVDRTMLDPTGVAFSPIPSAPLRKSPTGLARFALGLKAGRQAVLRFIDQHDVRLLVALGGFVAGPAVLAARKRKIRTVLLNLDDPPGRANRLLARLCAERWTAVPLRSGASFDAELVGMPIRRAALAGQRSPEDCRTELGLEPDRPTFLVTGASQGSTSLNELLIALLKEHPSDFAGWQVIHLTGDRPDAIESSRQACAEAGVPAVVEPCTSRIGFARGAADLARRRGGGSSVAEALANAVPTVFLPYPYHADQHQRRHVERYVEADLAWAVEDAVAPKRNLPVAGRLIGELLREPDRLAEVRERLVDRARPDAADAIAQRLLALLSTSR